MNNELEFKLPYLHDKQMEIWNAEERFIVIPAGRRSGKTYLGTLKCFITTMMVHGVVWWIAPSYPIAKKGWRMIKRYSKQVNDKKKITAEFWKMN